VADTLGAAWAVAHDHPERTVVVPPGQTTTELAALPVRSLRLDAKIVESLALVGVTTIASLLYLPRSSLTSRFGAVLLDRLDQALGNLPEVWRPFRPASLLSSRFPIGTPTTRLDILTEAIRRASARFCDCLDKRVAGVRELFVTFECPDVETDDGPQTQRLTRAINLSQPTRSSGHLFSLLKVMVEQLRLPAPADVLTLWARQLDKLDDWQDELFATDARDDRVLGDLLDRLVAHLGTEAVVRPQLLSEHQPERAFRYVSVTAVKAEHHHHQSPERKRGGQHQSPERKRWGQSHEQWNSSNPTAATEGDCYDQKTSALANKPPVAPNDGVACPRDSVGMIRRPSVTWPRKRGHATRPVAPVRQSHSEASRRLKPAAQGGSAPPTRPLRLLAQPVEIAATALVPEGPPVAFHLHGERHAVADSIGPERIETGWWRGPHVQRDYYRVITESGRRGWLFRERRHHRWFLHGWFD